MSNPFVPASWGETYILGGVTWMPEAEPLTRHAVTLDTTTDMSHSEGRLRYQELAAAWKSHTAPVLPSPDLINAQADPRAVAIAALERAGFENQCTRWALVIGNTADQPELRFWIEQGMFGLNTPLECFDPALARYAVDCFTTLHQWAAAINWDALEAQHD